jgi:hypothetical protein
MRNCIINGNIFETGKGAAINGGSSKYSICAKIINCTIVGNRSQGAAIYGCFGNNSSIVNTIIADNWPSQLEIIKSSYAGNYKPTIIYNDVENGYSGFGNINVDPCFIEPGHWEDANGIIVEPNHQKSIWIDGDYHLKSEGWSWDMNRHIWVYDDTTSRCIDAGNPGFSLIEEIKSIPGDPNNSYGENLRIDMGCYGGTTEASMPPYRWALMGDMDNSGRVSMPDFSYLSSFYGMTGDNLDGDLNRDKEVDLNDVVLLVEDWLKVTSWERR